jgi:hypothetical protein
MSFFLYRIQATKTGTEGSSGVKKRKKSVEYDQKDEFAED